MFEKSLVAPACRLFVTATLLLGAAQPHAMASGAVFGSVVIGNGRINIGDALLSPNQEFSAATTADGNFCVTGEYVGNTIWCARSSPLPAATYYTTMRPDANLCTSREDGTTAWCRTTASLPVGPVFLSVADNANLCVYQGTPSAPVLPALWCTNVTATPPAHPPVLQYGQIYNLQNGYMNSTGGYLDVRTAGCENNVLCVSTAYSYNRLAGSGSWMLVSAEGKANGSQVHTGDHVYLKSQFQYISETPPASGQFGGYLAVKGLGCELNVLCVSTATTAPAPFNSSVWQIIGPRTNTYQNEMLNLRSDYVSAAGYTYLDVRSSNCEQNYLCVSTSASSNRDQGSGFWRFQIASTKK